MDRLDALAAFVAVADEGSFAAAARRTRRSPTALTRVIMALEDHLGARLFTRTTRAVSLTDLGARHLEQARRVLAEVAEFDQLADGDRREPRGRLTVTAPVMFGRLHVAPLIIAFQRLHRDVTINLVLLDRVVSLVEEGVDVGVRIGHLPDSSLLATKVGYVGAVARAAPGYLARRGTPETPDQLIDHDVIAVANLSRSPDRWEFMSGGVERSVPIRPRLTVNQVEAGVSMAADGAGITRALSYQVATLERMGRLVPILEGFEPPPIPIHVVQPAGRHPSLAARRLIDTLVEGLRATPVLAGVNGRAGA